METMIKVLIRISAVILLVAGNAWSLTGQAPATQDILSTGTLRDQLKYIEDRTRIYENFRAIREDMFQKLKNNVADTLTAGEARIKSLRVTISDQESSIDSLKSYLNSTEAGLKEMTRTKNRIRFIGIELNKTIYNTIVTTIIAVLVFLLVTGFLAFKRNMLVTAQKKKELEDLKNEFEAYRKSAREAREKMSMDHFNEIKRLKGH